MTVAELAELSRDVVEIKAAVARIEQRLFIGNGTKPLATKVELLDGKVTALQSSWNGLIKFLLTICTALILSLSAFLWAVMVHAVTISTVVKVP